MDENVKEASGELLAQMRDAFHAGRWGETLSLCQQLVKMNPGRARRLEGRCLAVRALARNGQRREARDLVKELDSKVYKKPVHYEFLAYAYLELKQYQNAAKACERAEALRVAEEASG
jgi:hypothetical protein